MARESVRLAYCGDIMDRLKAIAQPSDLVKALEYFKERTGTPAEVLEVYPKLIASLGSVVPDGVELLPNDGVLTWEIWLSSRKWDGFNKVVETFEGKPSTAPPPTTPDSQQNKNVGGETPLNPISLPPQKQRRIKKRDLTHYNQNPANKSVTKGVTAAKSVTKGVAKRNKAKQLAFLETMDARITKLYKQGKIKREKSSRTIADKLRGEGFNISHMTVNRRIREYLGGGKRNEETH